MAGDDVKLPDEIPPKWLEQLKAAIKQDAKKTIWLAIISSSVLAALIGATANFGLEAYKDRNSRNAKSREEKHQAYKNLSEKLVNFESSLTATGRNCRFILTNKPAPQPNERRDTLNNLLNNSSDLFKAASSNYINDELRRKILEITEDVAQKSGPLLQNVDDQEANRNFATLYEKLTPSISEFKKKIIEADPAN